jgi:DNA primase
MSDSSPELTIIVADGVRRGRSTLTASVGSAIVFVDTFDLTKATARDQFVATVCERSGVDQAAVDQMVLAEAAKAVAQRTQGQAEEDADAPNGSEDLLAAMPEAVRAEAEEMLASPELLQTIVNDIGQLGVAGEEDLAATIYLLGTSRLLDKPLAAIVQGQSSSGKSYLIEKVATLFPPEATVIATRMTSQALFHLKPGSLIHRFVVAGERTRMVNDDTAEATRALREMLSGGKLVKLMPVKVGGGIETIEIRQDGPIAYVESTTLGEIFKEDANRCILVTTDEQQAQTRRIIDRLATGYARGAPESAVKTIVTRHHALQRLLRPLPVIVPFAQRLGQLMADERVEARRAFPQLISMIHASALLHQRQRPLDDSGRLEATQDDFQLARRLLAKPMERLLGGRLTDSVLRFYGHLCDWYGTANEFTTRDVMQRERSCKSSVYGWLRELHDAGLVTQVEAGRGQTPTVWRLLADPAGGLGTAVLPTTEELFDP